MQTLFMTLLVMIAHLRINMFNFFKNAKKELQTNIREIKQLKKRVKILEDSLLDLLKQYNNTLKTIQYMQSSIEEFSIISKAIVENKKSCVELYKITSKLVDIVTNETDVKEKDDNVTFLTFGVKDKKLPN